MLHNPYLHQRSIRLGHHCMICLAIIPPSRDITLASLFNVVPACYVLARWSANVDDYLIIEPLTVITQPARYVDHTLDKCWFTVYDADPTLSQRLVFAGITPRQTFNPDKLGLFSQSL